MICQRSEQVSDISARFNILFMSRYQNDLYDFLNIKRTTMTTILLQGKMTGSMSTVFLGKIRIKSYFKIPYLKQQIEIPFKKNLNGQK